MTHSLRTALVLAHRTQLVAAGHEGGQVAKVNDRTFIPACGCGVVLLAVGTQAAALDSLIRHLATAAELLRRNGAGNVQRRRRKMCSDNAH